MDLIERIDESIESLKDPENKVFDFDKQLDLLLELKNFVKEHSISHNVINQYKTKIENLTKTVSSLIVEKEVFATKHNECMNEVDKFYRLMQDEISSKMRSLNYTNAEIDRVSRIRNFSELSNLRDKILHEFDVKFKVQYTMETPSKKETHRLFTIQSLIRLLCYILSMLFSARSGSTKYIHNKAGLWSFDMYVYYL